MGSGAERQQSGEWKRSRVGADSQALKRRAEEQNLEKGGEDRVWGGPSRLQERWSGHSRQKVLFRQAGVWPAWVQRDA